MNNTQIAKVFEDLAGLQELKGGPIFTAWSYQRVARTIRSLPTELDETVRGGLNLTEIPGVGKAISTKITQLVTTGKMDLYERLRAEYPEGVLDIMRLPGVGPKTTALFLAELGVSTLDELEKAIVDGRVAGLPRIGDRKAENILRQIRRTREASSG